MFIRVWMNEMNEATCRGVLTYRGHIIKLVHIVEPFIEDMRMAKFADNTSLFYWGDGIGSWTKYEQIYWSLAFWLYVHLAVIE